MKNFFTILFVFSLISCNNVLHDKLGVEVAKEELKTLC